MRISGERVLKDNQAKEACFKSKILKKKQKKNT